MGDNLSFADNNAEFAPFCPFSPPKNVILPLFPVDSLPMALRQMALAVAENLQVAVDMPAVAMLAVLSLILQGKFVVSPKPGWAEPINLYVAIVALPSERKSPMLRAVTQHIIDFVNSENRRRKPEIEQYAICHAIGVKRRENATEAASKASGDAAAAMAKIKELTEKLAEIEQNEVRPLRLIADDITPEALTTLMVENGGKMAVVSSEGGIFDLISGRYSNKVNLDVLLKAYSGDPVQIDRKCRPSEEIERPALTMLLTVQPLTLEKIMGNLDFAGRGFLARFLYSLPTSMVGQRKYDTQPIAVDVEQRYNDLLDTLLHIPLPRDTGASVITLSPAAHQEAKRFFELLEPRLQGDLRAIEGWAGKMHGQIMRIAALLHCCSHGASAASVCVSVETMRCAQTIGIYFLAHAQAAFGGPGIADTQEVRDAKYILRRIGTAKEVSTRDLSRSCAGHFSTVASLEAGLAVLVGHGYIRCFSQKTGGRPSDLICVNPQYLG